MATVSSIVIVPATASTVASLTWTGGDNDPRSTSGVASVEAGATDAATIAVDTRKMEEDEFLAVTCCRQPTPKRKRRAQWSHGHGRLSSMRGMAVTGAPGTIEAPAVIGAAASIGALPAVGVPLVVASLGAILDDSPAKDTLQQSCSK